MTLLLQQVQKGHESIPLQATEVELVGGSIRRGHHDASVGPQTGKEPLEQQGIGHVRDLKFIKEKQATLLQGLLHDGRQNGIRRMTGRLLVLLCCARQGIFLLLGPGRVHGLMYLQHEFVKMHGLDLLGPGSQMICVFGMIMMIFGTQTVVKEIHEKRLATTDTAVQVDASWNAGHGFGSIRQGRRRGSRRCRLVGAPKPTATTKKRRRLWRCICFCRITGQGRWRRYCCELFAQPFQFVQRLDLMRIGMNQGRLALLSRHFLIEAQKDRIFFF